MTAVMPITSIPTPAVCIRMFNRLSGLMNDGNSVFPAAHPVISWMSTTTTANAMLMITTVDISPFLEKICAFFGFAFIPLLPQSSIEVCFLRICPDG